MTHIPLTDNLRVTTDAYNFILERAYAAKGGKQAGQTLWQAQGYYPTVESLLQGLLTAHILEADCKSLADISTATRRYTDVIQAIAKQFEAALREAKA